jgi:AcrR family transcriptional regulator
MFGAMIEGVAARGYKATSVAQLCRLAGVSKRTFYEQFDNKDACLLAASERIASCAWTRIEAAQHSQRDWESGARAAIEALVQGVVDQPHAADLALLALDGAGPVLTAHREQARLELERMVGQSFDRAPCEAALPPILAKALTCGVERVLRRSLLDSRQGEVTLQAGELAAWVLPFGSPAPAPAELSQARPTQLEREAAQWSSAAGRPGSIRARILRATGEVVARVGYSRLTADRIARIAGLRDEEVWGAYESTQECFLDALDLVGFEALMSAAKASRGGTGPTGVYRGISALMERVASDPVLGAMVFGELSAVGPAALERRERLLKACADLLAKGLAPSYNPSRMALEASVGAVWGVVQHHVLHDSAHLLPGSAAYVAYAALTPLVGATDAVEVLLPGEDRVGC